VPSGDRRLLANGERPRHVGQELRLGGAPERVPREHGRDGGAEGEVARVRREHDEQDGDQAPVPVEDGQRRELRRARERRRGQHDRVRGRDAEAAGDDAEGDAVEEVRGGERRCKSDSLCYRHFLFCW
jgi:hypothetical protein